VLEGLLGADSLIRVVNENLSQQVKELTIEFTVRLNRVLSDHVSMWIVPMASQNIPLAVSWLARISVKLWGSLGWDNRVSFPVL
jgi:hypothetical protein